jgi:HSP20 family molecular chaperone IbpA
MKHTTRSLIFGALVAWAATAAAQPAPYGGWGPEMGPPGFGAPIRLNVDSRMERDVYLIAIQYAGAAPDEVKIAQEGRDLMVSIERASGADGPMGRRFSSGRISRSVSLPPDADFANARRQEMPGLITYTVPRRFGPWR